MEVIVWVCFQRLEVQKSLQPFADEEFNGPRPAGQLLSLLTVTQESSASEAVRTTPNAGRQSFRKWLVMAVSVCVNFEGPDMA